MIFPKRERKQLIGPETRFEGPRSHAVGLRFSCIHVLILLYLGHWNLHASGQAVGLHPEILISQTSGDSIVSAPFDGDSISIKTTQRLAGAIDSVVWKGKEFIDSADHGRQLQSAVSMDCCRTGLFWPECYNPTEAGSRLDGAGATSSSQLLEIRTSSNLLWTRSRPAFWLAPQEKSAGHLAINEVIVSALEIQKKVRIGLDFDGKWFPNIIDYQVAFRIPESEKHKRIQFEALTGYMPSEFHQFFVIDASTPIRRPLDDGPGEQSLPILFSTSDEKYAMGCIAWARPRRQPLDCLDPFDESATESESKESLSADCSEPGYGRFRFESEQVVKWNCVYRSVSETAVPPGWYVFRQLVPMGPAGIVEDQLRLLARWKEKK